MKRTMRGVAALMAATLAMTGGNFVAQTLEKADKTVLTTEKEKVSYAIGMDVGKSFEPVAEFVDLAVFERAVKNAFDGGKPLQSEEEAKATDQALRMSIAAKQGAAMPGMPPGSQPPAVAKDKVGMMLGDRAVGPSLAPLKDEIDLAVFMQALRTSFAKGQLLLSEQDAMATMQAYMTRKQGSIGGKNRAEGAAFLSENKSEKGVITTPSGLQYMVLRQGNGARPTPSQPGSRELRRQAARRHRVRQLLPARRTGRVRPGPGDRGLGRGRAADAGRGQVPLLDSVQPGLRPCTAPRAVRSARMPR